MPNIFSESIINISEEPLLEESSASSITSTSFTDSSLSNVSGQIRNPSSPNGYLITYKYFRICLVVLFVLVALLILFLVFNLIKLSNTSNVYA